MFEILIIVAFVLGYLMISLEHPVRVDKAATALVTGAICWTLFVFGADEIVSYTDMLNSGYFLGMEDKMVLGEVGENLLDRNQFIHKELEHHLAEIASILFFLLGAMTIVELIDAHEGFSVITDKVKTTNKVQLIWLLCIISFFFSAVLDNLTTAIVMAALLKKLVKDKEDIWLFGGVIIIAANAGGAWSPIGDVTTIMLWNQGQVTAQNIIVKLIVPSMVCILVPLIILTFKMKGGKVVRPVFNKSLDDTSYNHVTKNESQLVFILGLALLLFVPVFKTITHLPPFMGILLGLGILWVVTEMMHRNKTYEEKKNLTVLGVLRKIDTSSVLFFLGILLAVACLQSTGQLKMLAVFLQESVGNLYIINLMIGVLSSVVDNVPLVAGAMGMYDIGPLVAGVSYPQDHMFWEFLAYCAGTGGSCLIIGSAAGVAIMGLLRIDFIWYIKRISLLALIGYLCGALTYYLMF